MRVLSKPKRPNMRKLQRLIDKSVKAHNAVHAAGAALDEYCLEIYGATPGDIDCDLVIDLVEGGDGHSPGMTAEAYDAAMRESVGIEDTD